MNASNGKQETVQKLIAECGFNLPENYIRFLSNKAPVEGHFKIQPYWFRIWPADEVLQANKDYNIQEFLPSSFAFGSSGGGELLIFDLRTYKIYAVDGNAMSEEEATLIAEDFESFVKAMEE